MTKIRKKAIILLSSGLDSVVSLAILKEKYDICLSLTFDYGQKSVKKELENAKKISDFYKINHKIVKTDWLEDLILKNSNWVPNRNAVFVNIAGSFAEKYNYEYIILGANLEEANDYKDNSKSFVKAINRSLRNSCKKRVRLITPLIKYDKKKIVKLGLKHEIPFELISSCYSNCKKHCGICESCLRLKNALELNKQNDLIKKLF